MPDDLFLRLRTETAACHTAIEEAVDVSNRIRTRDSYQALLARFYGFVAPFEDALSAALPDAQREFMGPRFKAPLLRDDLVYLTGNLAVTDALPRCTALPSLDSPAALWGALYVMEGSTLGGRMIAPMVAQSLGLSERHGYSYYEGYGERTGSMWKAFREHAAAELAPSEIDATVAAAIDTFERLGAWFRTMPSDSAAASVAVDASAAAPAPAGRPS
ncbi:MAG: biliverdin-producing heme oxygenase [Janthinobacterium lividum]